MRRFRSSRFRILNLFRISDFEITLLQGRGRNVLSRFLREAGVGQVEYGVFGAHMDVEIHNDGPVTLILERE